MTAGGRGTNVVAAVLTVVTLVACGAPTGSPARTIESVPYDLAAPVTVPSPTSPSTPAPGPQVYLVLDEVLVAASPVGTGPSIGDTAARALEQLAAGPTDRDRTSGMSTALGPEIRLSLRDLANGRATVDVRAGHQAPGAGRLPLAVGQIVLTLTSIPGVNEVLLTSTGQPIAAPLPGGALTDQPLSAGDYAELTVAPTSPTAGADTPAPT